MASRNEPWIMCERRSVMGNVTRVCCFWGNTDLVSLSCGPRLSLPESSTATSLRTQRENHKFCADQQKKFHLGFLVRTQDVC